MTERLDQMDIQKFLRLSQNVSNLKQQRQPTVSSDTLVHFQRIFVYSGYQMPHPNFDGYFQTKVILMRDPHPYQWMHYDYWPSEEQRVLLLLDTKKGGWLHDGPWQKEFDQLLELFEKEINDSEISKKEYAEQLKIQKENEVQALRDSYKI
jgi:hypothetical protein